MSDFAWLVVCVLAIVAGGAFIQWQEIKSAQKVADNRRNRKCAPPPPKPKESEE